MTTIIVLLLVAAAGAGFFYYKKFNAPAPRAKCGCGCTKDANGFCDGSHNNGVTPTAPAATDTIQQQN
jgi:hypothetical protein